MKKIILGAIALTTLTFANGQVAYCTLHPLAASCHPTPIDGKDGKDGAKGDKGDRGRKGKTGSTGATGASGSDGSDGSNGTDGSDGVDGLDGHNGIDGNNGSDGTDGTNGLDGNDFNADAYKAELNSYYDQLQRVEEYAVDSAAGAIATSSIDFGTTAKGVTEIGAGFGISGGNQLTTGYAGALGIKYGITDADAIMAKGWVSGNSSYGVGVGGTHRF